MATRVILEMTSVNAKSPTDESNKVLLIVLYFASGWRWILPESWIGVSNEEIAGSICVSLCRCVPACTRLGVCAVQKPQGTRMLCRGLMLLVWWRVCKNTCCETQDHLCSAQEACGQTTAISAHPLSSHFFALPPLICLRFICEGTLKNVGNTIKTAARLEK